MAKPRNRGKAGISRDSAATLATSRLAQGSLEKAPAAAGSSRVMQ